MRLTASQIASASRAETRVSTGDPDYPLRSFTWDSRSIQPGALFIALPGERCDGNDCIIEAFRRGAAVVLASRPPTPSERAAAQAASATLLVAHDGLAAFGHLATVWRRSITAKVVGITGSSGKTSTRELVAAVSATGFSTLESLANHNNEIGVPATVLKAQETTEVLVVEMAMRGLGQIAALCEIAQPHIGVITNVGDAHLELLGSREAIARAKAELIDALPEERGIAILNGDDPYSPAIRGSERVVQRHLRVMAYGLGAHNEVRAAHISYDAAGRPSFELWLPGHPEPLPTRLRLPGEHSVRNALAAAATGLSLGIAGRAIIGALEQVEPPPLRQVRRELAGGTVILDDSYNANPDSMRAALGVLAHHPKDQRHIAVLGDMFELGPDELALHHAIGAVACESGVDLLLTIGERALALAEGARQAGLAPEAVVSVATVEEAIALLRLQLPFAPVILVKASRSMRLERIAEELSQT
jgi:UDP-N-acetylmuramoyl-tripeptide--D-alanyl-D-alanine ligase